MGKSITKYYIKPSPTFSDLYYIVDRDTDIVEGTAFSEGMAKKIIEDYGAGPCASSGKGRGFEGIPPSFFLFT